MIKKIVLQISTLCRVICLRTTVFVNCKLIQFTEYHSNSEQVFRLLFSIWRTSIFKTESLLSKKPLNSSIDYVLEYEKVPTFASRSLLRNVNVSLLTCSERSLSMLRASMARPRKSLTSSSGSLLSVACLSKPSLVRHEGRILFMSLREILT